MAFIPRSFCFFGFFWGIFFFCAIPSSGLGIVCYFSVRTISVWQEELMNGLIWPWVPYLGTLFIWMCSITRESASKPLIQHYSAFWARAVKIQHSFWATDSAFKSWKMMLWKCCTQYASKFGKLSSGHRTGKGRFSFQSQRKAKPNNVQTTTQLHSSHILAK